ncbi:MAG: hypothetical protein OdinLCB4_002980 [Candidatus Odinarchaeum yellowstonii]|uniref:Uncharacterized protein n=1 Tax=Odinarchaeota yellowstonii (strain LCB_4) TaxID=1841599 RepID=A0AAF0D3F3_ODILC|nr:MAG: hypothetical protein OdinLCB4_002980 [Candidatus Odinarchaeum yellowstonii]
MFRPVKYFFFLLGYLPLIFALILRYVFNFFTIIGLIIFSIILIIILKYLLQVKGVASELTGIVVDKPRDIGYIAFIVTYIIPFLTFIDTATFIALIIVYSVISYIYVSTPLFSINPLLKIIFGYNIYVFKKDGGEFFLISKKYLNEFQNPVSVRRLDSDLFIEVFENLED